MPIGKDGYYNWKTLLGYSDATYLFALSDRGRGKTYGMRLFLLGQSGEFMCLYRTTTDMEHAISTWLDAPIESGKYIREQFEWDGNAKNGFKLIMIDGNDKKVKGYFHALTQVNAIKQNWYPDTLNYVFWDECVPLSRKKLPGIESEPMALRTILKTIDHDTAHPRESRGLKKLRCIITGNPFRADCEVFDYFHLDLMKGYGIHRAGPGVVYEILEPYKPDTTSRKMTVDDFLGNEVNVNQGWMDDTAFVIDKKPLFTSPWASIRIRGNFFGVHQRGRNLYVQIEKDHINAGFVVGTLEGFREGESRVDKTIVLDTVLQLLESGRVYFIGLNCKMKYLRETKDI